MFSQKNVLTKARILLLVTLLGAPLFLASCSSDFGPFPMPSGYLYHAKEYKAPPGPEVIFKKHERPSMQKEVKKESADTLVANGNHERIAEPLIDKEALLSIDPKTAATLVDNAWDNAAYDLLTGLMGSFGQPTEPVYIMPADSMLQAEILLERSLRRAMIEKGVNLAKEKGMGPYVMHYTVKTLNDYGNDSPVTMTLILRIKDKKVAEQSGVYYDLGQIAAPELEGGAVREPIMKTSATKPPPEWHEESVPAQEDPLSIRPAN